ncbi:C-X-C chemokine receptor type 6 [Ornithorhynchus anatinus]|uniref:C-X-C chemokine receptor type 6 n=1 Tax=Ornithorhynchus anatinus TaxID=9258 RepID=UPI0010A8AC77|nr:C-X-C chemokine receptor type 6 [Ornithorhynchus anatinus]
MADYDDSIFENEDNSSSTNDHGAFMKFNTTFVPCMYSLVFILGLVGNSLVLSVYVFYGKLKTLTDVFLVNLPMADLLFLCTLPFWAYTTVHEWIFGEFMCKLVKGLYTLNLYTSMLLLTCITVDRFISVAQATKAHAYQSRRLTWGKITCICMWLISLAVTTPQFIYSTVSNQDKQVCLEFGNSDSRQVFLVALAAQMTIGFFLPLLAMIVCYSVIIKTLIRAKGFQKHKSLKIIFLVVAVFVLTQLPYNLVKLIVRAHWEYYTYPSFHYALVVTESIAYLRACLNPVLYAFVGLKFRNNFWKLLRDLRCPHQLQITSNWRTTDEDASKTFTASNLAEVTTTYQL